MKHVFFKICILVGLFVGGTSVNADVLGPYLASETITAPEGYASVVPYMSSSYPVTGNFSRWYFFHCNICGRVYRGLLEKLILVERFKLFQLKAVVVTPRLY